jgi:hypothetical protein
LRDITKHNPRNQEVAFTNAVYYMHQFGALPFCSDFIGYLISKNKHNSHSISHNVNYDRIKDSLPDISKIKLDVVIEDPGSELTVNFPNLREDLIADQISITEKRRLVNPLVYALTLLVNSRNKRVKLKCLKFVGEICTVNGKPSAAMQEQVYRLILLVPELRSKLFTEYKM